MNIKRFERSGLSLLLSAGLLLSPVAMAASQNMPVSQPPLLAKQPGVRKPKQTELNESNSPILEEILRLKWENTALDASDVRKISLEEVFHQTLAHSIPVRQAEAKVKDAETEAKEIRDPGLFGLLNPMIDTGALKKAAEDTIQASKARLAAVRQKTLLESARMHADLVQAFMNKYLAFQSIEQGKVQLKAEQHRFTSGETNSFDVTQTRMALIDRYSKYLNADNAYHAASLALANQIGIKTDDTLIPAGLVLEDGNASVPLLKLLPDDLTVEKAVKTARQRPEAQEFQFRKTALERLIKSSSGLDRQRKEGERRQLELEAEKALNAAAILTEKAFNDYKLSQKNLDLSQQRYDLALKMLHQLEISRDAGFSSSKDVLDGQLVLAQAKTSLISAQVGSNLSQIQLVYEMGLLSEEIGGARPLAIPPNSL